MFPYTTYSRIVVCLCLALTCLVICSCSPGGQLAVQETPRARRTALVIGNAQYPAAVGPLRNPGNDATDMAALLKQLGFTVIMVREATLQQMEDALDAFHLHLRQGGVGLFYFAGHGVQIDGTNYLLPLDARVATATEVQAHAMTVPHVLVRMETARNPLNIVILDACRNNPFQHQWPSQQPPGLAPMVAARGNLVAYATAPGSVAVDGTGRNGVYTSHLLRALRQPGLPVEQVFQQVRTGVEADTRGYQVPWEAFSLEGNLILHPPTDTSHEAPALAPSY